MTKCPDCYSVKTTLSLILTGEEEGDGKCSACYGTGHSQIIFDELIDGMTGSETDCDECHGTGQCQTCGGTGVVDD
jgi:DnaJ-class molecular chaperone